MSLVFWGSIIGVFYAYFGYPLSLLLIGMLRSRRVAKKAIEPSVTLIITAYNEEKRIESKLLNTLEIDYPREKLEIIVASDGSTDKTNDIVRRYSQKEGVKLLAFDKRRGKEFAQKDAVAGAKGDVLVFTDVATRLRCSGLREIVGNFSDPSVGCVSSEDRIERSDGQTAGEGFYVRYEMLLRRLETRAHSLVGLSGSFFAARKEVCRDFSADMQSDFKTLLNSIRLGLRGVSDVDALGYYLDVTDPKKELERKLRTIIRGLTVFFQHLELLNVFRYGLFSYQLFCHKLLRWLVPIFLSTALLSNLVLAFGSGAYLIIFLFQLMFFAVAAITLLKKDPPNNLLLKIPGYFLSVNLAIAIAWWRYLSGYRVLKWTPSER
jgi:cellulose synthase/poly-beta-1,6-N-acetylglucosamine synthase-like glycosyltransferase